MKLIFVLIALASISAQATCPLNRTALVRTVAYSRATDALTYCGTNMKIVEILSKDECSLTDAEALGQIVYLGNGQLMNGHDCETPLNEGDILDLKIVQINSKLRVLPEVQILD